MKEIKLENQIVESIIDEMKVFVEYNKEHSRMVFNVQEVELFIQYLEHLNKVIDYKTIKVREQIAEITNLKNENRKVEKDYIEIVRTLISLVSCNYDACGSCPFEDKCGSVDIQSCRDFLSKVYLNE